MKKIVLTQIILLLSCVLNAQENSIKLKPQDILQSTTENVCKCVDSIKTYNKKIIETTSEIAKCIDKNVVSYQLAMKMNDTMDESLNNPKKEITININQNKDSKEYKKYYFEIERELMQNCIALKKRITVNDELFEKSLSNNKLALEYYSQGLTETEKKNYKNAVKYYKKAVKEDPNFTFAWDNLGLNYRKLNDYNNAIESYKKSLAINPKGLMPATNIAIAYHFKKDYQNAKEAFNNLAKLDENNPEVYYGMGNVYREGFKDYENALENYCKAYILYIKNKSPYRTDAEKLINDVKIEMEKLGNKKAFNDMLKKYNINY